MSSVLLAIGRRKTSALVALTLAGVIVFLGALDLLAASTGASPASGGLGGETLQAQTLGPSLVSTDRGCWVPGDLIGDANPASVRC
jgi:hypothetical protein